MLFQRTKLKFDWALLSTIILIPIIGLIVLYSSGYDSESAGWSTNWLPFVIKSKPFLKQLTFLSLGILAILLVISIPSHLYHRYSYLIYFVFLLILLGLLIFGYVSHGSRRWFTLGSLRFQPSEVMKIALILAMARFLSSHPPKDNSYSFKELMLPVAVTIIPMVLIIQQPDLGTALTVGFIGISMILYVGVKLKTFLITSIGSLLSLVPLWLFVLRPYQQRRVLSLLNPDSDPLGSGYHIIQSKIAVGSGKLFGKGYFQGTQTQLEFLPEHTTDFVFSVLAEEWGFFGSVLVLSLYFFLIYRILRISLKSKDLFSALVYFGISMLIFFHVFVNIGMVIGILPVVGLPLPLFSYGGSSLMVNLAALGIVLGMDMRRLIFAGNR
ncbi:UNVERIFIED_CONTAM: hypothetical protein GTU68_015950 [Idotea baltica]|nr:hypothetical protein [Idotea baltica]